MKLIHILAGVAATLAAAAPSGARDYTKSTVRVRTDCIGDRCALYVRGKRVGSVTYDTGRYVVKDVKGKVVSKVTVEPRR